MPVSQKTAKEFSQIIMNWAKENNLERVDILDLISKLSEVKINKSVDESLNRIFEYLRRENDKT